MLRFFRDWNSPWSELFELVVEISARIIPTEEGLEHEGKSLKDCVNDCIKDIKGSNADIHVVTPMSRADIVAGVTKYLLPKMTEFMSDGEEYGFNYIGCCGSIADIFLRDYFK